MKLPLYNQHAENVGTIELSDSIFNAPMNHDLLYQVVTSQLSNTRQTIAHTKDRSEVRGGGKKPWKQKGTGRARHGSIRSPLWKGGGTTFGPRNDRNFKKKINRKMAKKALLVALSSKVRDQELAVIEDIKLEHWKTKEMAAVMKQIAGLFKGRMSSALVITPINMKDTIRRVVGNLPNVDVIEARELNALEVMSRRNLLLLKDSVAVLSKE